MAMIFGVQLLSTLIIGLFMTKIFSNYSYGLLIFYNLWFCVPPLTEHLGSFSQAYKDHMKKKPRNGDKKEALEDFTIPRDSDFKVRYNKIISYTQIKLLPHGEEIDMIVLMSLSSVLIYLVTELSIYFNFTPVTDLHLSYIWSLVVILFCVKFLCYMFKVYIQLGGGERSLCALSTFLFIVFALFVSMADKRSIDFGIDEGYTQFVDEFLKFGNSTKMIKGGKEVTMPTVKAFKGFLIVLSGFIGALLTFPSFRFGALNSQLLRSANVSVEGVDKPGYKESLYEKLTQVLVHFNLITPLLVILCWCKPLVQEHIETQVDISDKTFSLLRIGFIALIMLVRLFSIKLYAQTHLDSAKRYVQNLKREAGRIDHKTVQQKIAYTFQYSSVVVLQILTPALVVLQLCLILLSLQNLPEEMPSLSPAHSILAGVSDIIPDVVSQSDVTVFQGMRAVLTKNFLTSVTSYLVWWIVSVNAGVSLFSTCYHHVSEQV